VLFGGVSVGGVINSAAEKDTKGLNRAAVDVVVLAVIGGIAGFFRSWLFTLSGHRIVAKLRKEVFGAMLARDIPWFDSAKTGELTSRLSSDCTSVQTALTVNFSMMIRNISQITGYLVFLFVISAKLTALVFMIVPIIGLVTWVYVRFVKSVQELFQDELGEANGRAEEVLAAVRTVKTFSNEEGEEKAYGDAIDKTLECGRKQSIAEGAFQASISVIIFCNVGLVLWVGGKLAIDGSLSLGALVSFLFYTIQLAAAFVFIGSLMQDFAKAQGATIRIFGILDLHEETIAAAAKLPKEEPLRAPAKGEIGFKDVSFFYPSRPDVCVLKQISFTAHAGESTAFVGPSGSGKSTIISLVLRMYEPYSGSVTLDDTPLSRIRPKELHDVISIVSQEPTLFSCSILDNVRYASDYASLDDVIAACKMANAYEFIMKFPEQFDTKVGERGVQLSGGQKQRIAIARALLRKPKVLLLDEATSALDSESEAVVQEALDRAQEGRTVLQIAHRLSTVVSASKIIVIDAGNVAEYGTHAELMKSDGLYADLVARQNLDDDTQDSDEKVG